MEATLATIFESVRVGRVLVVFSNDVLQAVRSVQSHAESLVPVPTFVQLEWERAPELTRELREIECALAEAVNSVWPGWHRSANERFEHRKFPLAERELRLLEAQRSVPHLSTSWFREAFTKCAQGEAPLIEGMALAEQVHQLTLALDPVRPLFCLSVASEDASEARVHGLARAAEWLAKQSQAPVLLFVPLVWVSRASLDPVNYEAVELLLDSLPNEPQMRASATAPLQFIRSGEGEARICDEPVISRRGYDQEKARSGPTVAVFPVPGKPHPLSACEKRMAMLLQTDEELGPLFEFNQGLKGLGQQLCIVDLLWAEGRLIVELDGDEHRSPIRFKDDRERDYRSFLAGYATLRVTNHEVIADSERVLEKIRNMVRSRALQLHPDSDSRPSQQTAASKAASPRRKPSSSKKRNSA